MQRNVKYYHTMKTITDYDFFTKLIALPFVDEIWLYGSRARGTHHAKSDYDLAFICPNATKEDWINVVSTIEDADTLYKIDYVRFDTLPESEPLRTLILRDKKLLYKRVS